MIGELIKEKADLALASFPVTKERTEVVDFTPPLFDHGLAILYKKPQVDAEGKLLIPFANVYELSRQTAIQYGIVAGGSTSHFFKNSQAEPFKRMWAFMEAHPEQSFVNDYEKGIERVQNYNGTFAFIMEKLAAEYVMGRACDTMVIGFGERWNSTVKGSSLALPLSSPWKLTLSRLIEELKADGSIAALYEKWWKGTC
ncbi:glutamate receptor-like [Paramacrobiotus metropolitanus]|uniref:glutamate receptor-like n=1 Tax=Paramacrobiotus metropolitanus TaxID=2943436 RepID=UPI0024460979|nr:glutamate receptor-like [Paramacrobiotus metropolitanus]